MQNGNSLFGFITNLCKISILILSLISFFAQGNTQIHHYDIKVKQDIDSHSLAIITTITLSTDDLTSVELVLNKSASLSSVRINGSLIDFQFDKSKASPFMYAEDGRGLTFLGNKTTLKEAQLTLNYKVDIDVINYIKNPQHIELGLYSAWYPLNVNYGKFKFDVFWLGEGTYQFMGNGDAIRKNNGWLLSNTLSDIDIVILLSKKPIVKPFSVGNSSVNLISLDENNDSISKLASDTKQILAYYQRLLGNSSKEEKSYQFVFVPRSSGPSYSRKQFAVISQGSEAKYDILLKTIAHEIGHFWWNKADTQSWQDWLNESFAEYSALMALESVLGKEHVDALLNDYSDIAASLPPIKGIERSSRHAQNVLYKKGPVLLHGLKKRIGEPAFNAWLRRLLTEKVSNFNEFITVSECALGPNGLSYILFEVSR